MELNLFYFVMFQSLKTTSHNTFDKKNVIVALAFCNVNAACIIIKKIMFIT